MAAMMKRTVEAAGIDTTMQEVPVDKFVDDGLMHDWSRDSIYFMNAHNILNGVGGNRYGVKENCTVEQAIATSLRSVKEFEK